MNNAVGTKAQKCKTSLLLDEAFQEGGEVGTFSIPNHSRRLLRAQLRGTRDYVPLPGRSIAESLQLGVRSAEPEPTNDVLTFIPSPDEGWVSERSCG